MCNAQIVEQLSWAVVCTGNVSKCCLKFTCLAYDILNFSKCSHGDEQSQLIYVGICTFCWNIKIVACGRLDAHLPKRVSTVKLINDVFCISSDQAEARRLKVKEARKRRDQRHEEKRKEKDRQASTSEDTTK